MAICGRYVAAVAISAAALVSDSFRIQELLLIAATEKGGEALCG